MKKICTLAAVLALSLSFVLAGCKEKHEKIIESFMIENLDDPDSYEPISYGVVWKLDARDVYGEYFRTEYQRNHYIYINKLGSESGKKEIIHIMPREETVDSAVTIFMDKYLGNGGDPDRVYFYKVAHKYRSANRYGGVEKHEEDFLISGDMKKVLAHGTNEQDLYGPIYSIAETLLKKYDK